ELDSIRQSGVASFPQEIEHLVAELRQPACQQILHVPARSRGEFPRMTATADRAVEWIAVVRLYKNPHRANASLQTPIASDARARCGHHSLGRFRNDADTAFTAIRSTPMRSSATRR